MDNYEAEREIGYRTRETYYHKVADDNYKIVVTEDNPDKFAVFLQFNNSWYLLGFGNRQDWQDVIDSNERNSK